MNFHAAAVGKGVIILSSARTKKQQKQQLEILRTVPVSRRNKAGPARFFGLFVSVFSAEDLMKLQFERNKSTGAQWSMPAYC